MNWLMPTAFATPVLPEYEVKPKHERHRKGISDKKREKTLNIVRDLKRCTVPEVANRLGICISYTRKVLHTLAAEQLLECTVMGPSGLGGVHHIWSIKK